VKLCPFSSQAHAITFAGTRAFFDRGRHRLGQPSSKLLSFFFFIVITYLCRPLSLYCPAFRVSAVFIVVRFMSV